MTISLTLDIRTPDGGYLPTGARVYVKYDRTVAAAGLGIVPAPAATPIVLTQGTDPVVTIPLANDDGSITQGAGFGVIVAAQWNQSGAVMTWTQMYPITTADGDTLTLSGLTPGVVVAPGAVGQLVGPAGPAPDVAWSGDQLVVTGDNGTVTGPHLTGPLAGPADIAAQQGFWPVYSATPPADTTMYGYPVVWFDATEVVAPTPVNPSAPTWNDANGQFTVPSTVVGVDYVWTSGGGGIGGTVTQGSTQTTSGTYPRSVVVTPVARPGYVLATSGMTFNHDFPDPSAITVLTSDGFSGSATTDITGRTPDLALGGTAGPTWLAGSGAIWSIDGSGHATTANTVGWNYFGPFNGVANLRIEFDLVSFSGTGNYGNGSGLLIGDDLGLPTGAGGFNVCFGSNGGLVQIYAQNATGNSVWNSTLVTATGHWVIQRYVNTVTITDPSGNIATFTTPDGAPTASRSKRVYMRNSKGSPIAAAIDNLKVSKVGF